MRSQRPGSPLWPPTRTSSCSRRPSRAALQQAVDRFRYARIADEHPLDRPHLLGRGGADQIEIGGVGVDHPAGVIRDQQGLARAVDDRLEQRVRRVLAGRCAECRRRAQTAGTRRPWPAAPANPGYRVRHWRGRSAAVPRPRPPARQRSAARGRCCRRADLRWCGRPPRATMSPVTSCCAMIGQCFDSEALPPGASNWRHQCPF